MTGTVWHAAPALHLLLCGHGRLLAARPGVDAEWTGQVDSTVGFFCGDMGWWIDAF